MWSRCGSRATRVMHVIGDTNRGERHSCCSLSYRESGASPRYTSVRYTVVYLPGWVESRHSWVWSLSHRRVCC